MAVCEVFGNDYYLSFEVIAAGHGIEANETF